MAHFSHGTAQIFHEVMGHGEPILFLPGVFERTSDRSALLNLLAAHYLVVAADLPGSGRSLPQPRIYPVTYYQDDAEALSALIRTLTDGPVHLVGCSDGGEVALLIAALYPELARSVLVWGAAGAAPPSSGRLPGTPRQSKSPAPATMFTMPARTGSIRPFWIGCQRTEPAGRHSCGSRFCLSERSTGRRLSHAAPHPGLVRLPACQPGSGL